jgi:uncharacterized phage-associated protein
MSYKAVDVATYFLHRARAEGKPVDPMKLQKLVYFAHGWHLALAGEPLIVERVQAWPYGPVIEELYHAVKRYGRSPIPETAALPGVSSVPGFTEYAIDLMDRIWEQYRKFSGIQLSMMTHAKGTPWWHLRQAYGPDLRDVPIDNDDIRGAFIREAERNKQSRPVSAGS